MCSFNLGFRTSPCCLRMPMIKTFVALCTVLHVIYSSCLMMISSSYAWLWCSFLDMWNTRTSGAPDFNITKCLDFSFPNLCTHTQVPVCKTAMWILMCRKARRSSCKLLIKIVRWKWTWNGAWPGKTWGQTAMSSLICVHSIAQFRRGL